MADQSLSLINALLEAAPDQLREILCDPLRKIMDGEASAECNAPHGVRSIERTNYRNGYRKRTWDTRVGNLELEIPRLREGSYYPSFLEPRRRVERALYAVIAEAYVHGVSTRSVDKLVAALGASGISKSEVSRICAELDQQVQDFLNRPLEGLFPYVWLDATYVKARQAGRIVDRAIVVAIGLNESGRREVLGMIRTSYRPTNALHSEAGRRQCSSTHNTYGETRCHYNGGHACEMHPVATRPTTCDAYRAD